jgi:hypothetical protein
VNVVRVATKVQAAYTLPECFAQPGFAMLRWPGGRAKLGWFSSPNLQDITFPAPQPTDSELDPADSEFCYEDGQLCSVGNCSGAADAANVDTTLCYPQFLLPAERVRYQIANGPDGVPSLYRSSTGGRDDAGNLNLDPTSANAGDARWRLVARGIEDLQVVYIRLDGTGTEQFTNEPLPVVVDDPTTIVKGVRITLSARALGEGIEGQMRADNDLAVGRNAVRGQLMRVVTIPAALRVFVGINGTCATNPATCRMHWD